MILRNKEKQDILVKMILIKRHRTPTRTIAALCDKELVGKTFEDADKRLEVSKRFYGDKEAGEKEMLRICEGADDINFVGKESVDFAVKNNYIEKGNIMVIKGVPYAICIKM